MIALDDNEIDVLLTHMALDSEGFQVRQIAVMTKPSDVKFEDSESGEEFDADTTARIWTRSRERLFWCHRCDRFLPIEAWTRESHGVDMCSACYQEALKS